MLRMSCNQILEDWDYIIRFWGLKGVNSALGLLLLLLMMLLFHTSARFDHVQHGAQQPSIYIRTSLNDAMI